MSRTFNYRVRVYKTLAAGVIFLSLFNRGPSAEAEEQVPAYKVNSFMAYNLPGDKLYTSGFSCRAGVNLPFSQRLDFTANIGIDQLTVEDTATVLSIPLTVGIAAEHRFGAEWKASAGFGLGGYIAPVIGSAYDTGTGAGPALEVSIGLQREILPSFSAGLSGRWAWHIGTAQVWVPGLSVMYAPSQATVRISPGEIGPLFPNLYDSYRSRGIGDIVIVNTSPFSIELMNISCAAPPYTAGAVEVPINRWIDSDESVSLPIRLDFTDRILGVVGDFTLSCDITAVYRQGSRVKKADLRTPLRILDRNSIMWDDDAKACLFITEKDPAVRRFMGQAAAGLSARGRSFVNRNFALAVAVMAAFDALPLTYIKDPVSPYSLSHSDKTVDFLRFPRETLYDGIGDCDDSSVLFCALLESAGIETALITVPGHIFAAASLDMDTVTARKQFASGADLLDIDGRAWLPLETTITDNFIKSWRTAADQYRKACQTGEAGFLRVRSGWGRYPPIALHTADTESSSLNSEDFNDSLERMISDIVISEMEPLAAKILGQIQQGGKGVGRSYNRLGILYARYGQLERARAAFRASVDQTRYGPAMVNLSNVLLLLGEYRQALELYQSYYAMHPRDAAAVLGISMARFRLGQYDECARAYEVLEQLDPLAAADNAYLVVKTLEDIAPSRASILAEEVLWTD